jgi:hypothetical protein
MAAKDLSKETIARELALLLNRVVKTTELNPEYQGLIIHHLDKAQTALKWEQLGIPFEVFESQ